MDLDLDRRKIGFFYLGQQVHIPYESIRGEGYTVYFGDSSVKGICLSFSPGIEREETPLILENRTHVYVSETPRLIFKDKIIKNGNIVTINKDTTPQEVANLFNVACEYLDDDTCIGMRFSEGDCHFELKWTRLSKHQMQLDSMLLEI